MSGDVNHIHDARVGAGLTQQKLAQLADCSIASVRLFEGGYRPRQSATLTRIERILADRAEGKETGR